MLSKISLLLVLCLTVSIFPSAHFFTDVPANCWFDDAVQYVYENGFMNGTSSTTFSPEQTLDRGMIVTVLYRMNGSPAVDIEIPFNDVSPNHYFYKAIQWAYQNGVVKGVTETEFMPLRSITRAEMVTMFYRCFGDDYKATETELNNYVDSVSIPNFAYDAFAWSVKNGVVTGMSTNTIGPLNTSNRAQCAVIIQRLDTLHEHVFSEWITTKEATAKESGEKERVCEICGKREIEEIPQLKLSDDIVAYFKVIGGKAIDLVTGCEISNSVVTGDYWTGGVAKLPQNYSNWTYQMVVDYNESSTKGIIKSMSFKSNSGKYEECYDLFRLNEVNSITSRGSVVIPWVKDSWNHGYSITIPVQLYAHVSTKYEYLPIGDTFWSFSMDSDNGVLNARINGGTASTTMSTWTDTNGETKYVDKILKSSLAFTSEHLLKEVIIYNRPLTIEEQEKAYLETGITPPTTGVNKIVNGLTDMGSSLYITKDNEGNYTFMESEKEPGTYTVTEESGLTTTYTISDYVQPNMNIDNSMYESVHIVNEPTTLDVGKQYPLVAYPYPFVIKDENEKASQFDVYWETSDSDIITVIDGLLIAKKAGTVEITATLFGTEVSDTVTVTVVEPEKIVDKPWNVPANYVSEAGNSFSDTDYKMTTRAIYEAIDEAVANGYNHIIFPKINFYAQPITNADGTAKWYYVPSNMTIEFPEGSVFYMMDNEVSRGPGNLIEIHYFHFGVPNNDYQNVCKNSHLIIDTFYGERYNNTTHKETEYLEENRFVNFGRKSINCSVEVRNAYSTAGYFIVADGTASTNKKTGVMNYGDFVSGWLNDNGELEANSNWISTNKFITVPDYGTDGYFISADGQDSYAGKYWGGCSARTYDILWFDENEELILIERFNGRGDYYDIPTNAAYFKVSLQQPALPTLGTNETLDSPWISMHDDGASKMCEIKNTKVWNSACGVFSVVGLTDGLWIHDCFTNRDGMKPYNERTGDFENGWQQMRHSIVSNNFLIGYFANHGYNTFIHTNFMTNYSGFGGDAELLRFINNTTDTVEVSEKCQAHYYYNTVHSILIDRFSTSIGHHYKSNNDTGKWVRSY